MNLSDFRLAGYFITHPVDRPEYISDLLPDKIISMSGCFSKFYPDIWAIEWCNELEEEIQNAANFFGISDQVLPDLRKRTTSEFEKKYLYPNVCSSLEHAKYFQNDLKNSGTKNLIIGLALHKSYLEKFLKEAKPPQAEPGPRTIW